MSNTTKDYLFVGIQFALFAAYAIRPQILSIELPKTVAYAGLVIAISGLCTGVLALIQIRSSFSPFPTPVAHGELVSNGLFRLSRHPIYSSILLGAFGYALYTGSGDRLLIGLGFLLLFYFKSSYEEQLLSEKYAGYTNYKRRVGRFTPWW